MNMISQKEQTLKHITRYKNGITPKVAYDRYGIMRLSGVIFRLRQDGYNIITEDVIEKNRFGQTVRYARYKLVG